VRQLVFSGNSDLDFWLVHRTLLLAWRQRICREGEAGKLYLSCNDPTRGRATDLNLIVHVRDRIAQVVRVTCQFDDRVVSVDLVRREREIRLRDAAKLVIRDISLKFQTSAFLTNRG
jgi:hypothetical protein